MSEIYGWDENTPFYKASSQNCSDMILKADWKSIYSRDFYDAFKTATDYGACCLITPYLDFQNPKTKDISPENYTGADYHSIPKGVTRNGIQNGMKIILDVENYDYAYFPRGAKGFRAVVGDSRDKAVINQNGFYVAVGNNTSKNTYISFGLHWNTHSRIRICIDSNLQAYTFSKFNLACLKILEKSYWCT